MKHIVLTQYNRDHACDQVRNTPDGHVLTIREETRNLEQNAKLHAMIGDIQHQVKWKGLEFNTTVWKRLLTASFLREIGEDPMLIPSLDNTGVDIIYEKTSNMGIKRMASFIEWVYAFGAENGVVWSERYPEEPC